MSHVFLSGKTPVSCLATPVPHKGRRASMALICLPCSKEGVYILAKQCVSSERCAMPKACSVCHHGNKVEQTRQLQTKLSLQDVGLVVFLNLARRSLFFVKHDKRTDKATNHNDCTNNFSDRRRVASPSAPWSKSETFSKTQKIEAEALIFPNEMEVLPGPLPDGRRSGGDEGLGSRLAHQATFQIGRQFRFP